MTTPGILAASDDSDDTVITAANIPSWLVADTFDLTGYLAANPHVNVLRVFAREVTITGPLRVNASIDQPPLTLRIDCRTLVFDSDHGVIDLDGTPGDLGWKTYAGTPTAVPVGGLDGWPGGNLEINALEVLFNGGASAPGQVSASACGGDGGSGQGGYPGWPGSKGAPGRTGTTETEGHYGGGSGGGGGTHTIVSDRGTGPGNGAAGSAGGPAGPGGSGGAGGAIAIVTGAGCVFSAKADGGAAGVGGTGGAGGDGGVPGDPTMVYANLDPHSEQVATGTHGPAGAKGADGAPGAKGAPGAPQTRAAVVPAVVYEALASDVEPAGVRVRVHALISRVLRSAVIAGAADASTLSASLDWLEALAQPAALNFPEVVVRIQEIEAMPAGGLTANILSMTPDALQKVVTHLSTAGADSFNHANPHLAAVLGNAAAAAAQDGAIGAAGGPTAGLAAGLDFYATFAQSLQAIAASLQPQAGGLRGGLIELPSWVGTDGAVADEGVCDGLAAATGEEIIGAEMMLGPEGLAAAAVTALAIGLLSLMSYLPGEAALSAARAKLKSDLALQKKAMDEWTRAESLRSEADGLNNEGWPREAARFDQARRARKRNDDLEPPIVAWGTEFIAVLTEIEAVEDGSNQAFAKLDGFLMPRITTPAALAAFIAAAYLGGSFLLTVKIPSGTPQLVIGDWHVVTLTSQNPGDTSTLEPAVRYPRPGAAGGTGGLAQGIVLLPAGPVSASAIRPADPLLALALAALLQYMPVPTAAYTPPGFPKPSGLQLPPAVTQMTMFNVRQGTFHTLAAGAAAQPFAVADMGGSSSWDVSPTVTAGLQAVQIARPIILMSHWDRDHYRLLLGFQGQIIQQVCRVLGPAVGISGPTLVGLIEALGSQAPGHLCLVGSQVANTVQLAGKAALEPSLAGFAGVLPVPPNVHLSLTSKVASGSKVDKNNTEALVLTVRGQNLAMLMPGDASFSYVAADAKTGISLLEATHHGSRLSIMAGTAGAATDIPPGTAGATQVLYSTAGAQGQYHHGVALTGDLYRNVGWTAQLETTGGDIVRAL